MEIINLVRSPSLINDANGSSSDEGSSSSSKFNGLTVTNANANINNSMIAEMIRRGKIIYFIHVCM